MTACVFLGPTLPQASAKKALDAVYLPPVRQGDVFRAVERYRPKVIGIVDGSFHQVPSVWHKEILFAMAEGVQVLGSASMGALRAAELHPFGMEGAGTIFAAFRDGVLEDDDEVAVVHGPSELGFVAASEAMVNIRATLDAARDHGVVALATAERLTAIAKAFFYVERTYPAILERGAADGLPSDELAAIGEWLDTGRIDRKREDALSMLTRIKALLGEDRPKAVEYSFEHTTLWEAAVRSLREEVREAETQDEATLAPWLLDEIRLDEAHDDLRRAALLHLLALEEAERRGLDVAGEEHGDALTAFRLQRGLHRGADLRAWLAARDLERPDLDRLIADDLLLGKLLELHGHRLSGLMIDELRKGERWEALVTRAREKRQALLANGRSAN